MAAKKKAEKVAASVDGDRVAALSVRADGTLDQRDPVLLDAEAAREAAAVAVGEKAAAELVAGLPVEG